MVVLTFFDICVEKRAQLLKNELIKQLGRESQDSELQKKVEELEKRFLVSSFI